jgi:hypothetical protein
LSCRSFATAATGSDARHPSTCIRQHTSAYVSVRQRTSAYVSVRQHTSTCVSMWSRKAAYTSSLRPHTSVA